MTTVVLIHGACHTSGCWDPVRAELTRLGVDSVAPDLPCDDPSADLAAQATAVVDALPADDDVLLVGHSLGGVVATAAAGRMDDAASRLRGLVFVAGIVPVPGRSLADLVDEDADRDLPMGDDAIEVFDDGTFRFTRDAALRLLYHDCDPATVEAAIAQLRPQRSLWSDRLEVDEWPTSALRSIVCRQDRIVDPAWSERIAHNRLGTEPELLDCGHSPMLVEPAALASLLCRDVSRS